MDRTDWKIVKELMEDARKPFTKIAKKIGISTQSVIKRYNKLKDDGTIQLCSISLDLEKIGYKGIAYLLMKSSHGSSLDEAIVHLRKTKNIIITTRAIGDFEGYAILIFKDLTDLYDKVSQIKKFPNIERIELSFSTKGTSNFLSQRKFKIYEYKQNPSEKSV
ncbi:MAG: Lrp/AsnC family transcriptional regulator [Candidatus Bathyarchaeota archaeon]|nr:Lrp/AsnC family transcriptional regulator [Candidatus Bathyarchaeum sp.]